MALALLGRALGATLPQGGEDGDQAFLDSIEYGDGQEVVVQASGQEAFMYFARSKVNKVGNNLVRAQARALLLLAEKCAQLCGYGSKRPPPGGFKMKASTTFKVTARLGSDGAN
jgi:hypothetical protein